MSSSFSISNLCPDLDGKNFKSADYRNADPRTSTKPCEEKGDKPEPPLTNDATDDERNVESSSPAGPSDYLSTSNASDTFVTSPERADSADDKTAGSMEEQELTDVHDLSPTEKNGKPRFSYNALITMALRDRSYWTLDQAEEIFIGNTTGKLRRRPQGARARYNGFSSPYGGNVAPSARPPNELPPLSATCGVPQTLADYHVPLAPHNVLQRLPLNFVNMLQLHAQAANSPPHQKFFAAAAAQLFMNPPISPPVSHPSAVPFGSPDPSTAFKLQALAAAIQQNPLILFQNQMNPFDYGPAMGPPKQN
ncbi:Fork head domain transcription factor slp2 isoform X2 [Aphelenchoides fujianensis]|nr:Fork head domain transcription factor slp2 isoform X2 [Aphelenchoides fujianensis]